MGVLKKDAITRPSETGRFFRGFMKPRKNRSISPVLTSMAVGLLLLAVAGCTQSHYRKSADKEVYGILRSKELATLKKTNSFNIDTRYSKRDPNEIKAEEIIKERLANGKQLITLSNALQLAVENNRTYQLHKENLYLIALTLTKDRYDFGPKFTAGSSAGLNRDNNANYSRGLTNQISVTQLLKTGGLLSGAIVNDVLRFYTGNPRPSATTLMSIDFMQPLLRGAGADIVAETLKQSERNVIYEVRSFAQFQKSFAVDVITAYYRILQQKDTVRNQYNNYRQLVQASQRAEALSHDRLPPYQADQARQDELRAKSTYIGAVQHYQDLVDQFKITLGLPIGVDVGLDEKDLQDLAKVGLIPVNLDEDHGFSLAVTNELDVVNEIDRFEDTKRKIKVAANALKADFNIIAGASLQSDGPTDYTHFNSRNAYAYSGLELNLPIDRLRERNTFRASFINFERELRNLSLTFDNTRENINSGLRTLRQAWQNYDIQIRATELAQRRVESVDLLLQAGRAEIRDQLDAQTALIQAQNAVTQSLVDYHVARLGLLRDIGLLNIDEEQFWLRPQILPGSQTAPGKPIDDQIVAPEQLFGER